MAKLEIQSLKEYATIRNSGFLGIKKIIPAAIERMNGFNVEVLKTRGGRIGSGMGGLLEALWGFYMNIVLKKQNYEIAWFPDHQYHDFACLLKDVEWDLKTQSGELFRIEAKSMNMGADESKAHFDVLSNELNEFDSLLILIWEWKKTNPFYSSPYVVDYFFGLSKPITVIRDALHEARGGSFVNGNNCPDLCDPKTCKHVGEPLNEQGKRERLSGPESRRPSSKVSYAANFGGLVRMLKTNTNDSRRIFRQIRKSDNVIDGYISFIHRNFPDEERNHFSIDELREVANRIGIKTKGLDKEALYENVKKHPKCLEYLKCI